MQLARACNGENPLLRVCTRFNALIGPVAQGIEQWFPKPCAACSNHAGATRNDCYLSDQLSQLLIDDPRGRGEPQEKGFSI